MELIEIDPNGDVLLDFEDHGGIIFARMRVASAALRLGSKVFKKMFGPEFREGQQLAAGRCVYLRIDDDLTTMEIICKALHHQYSTLMHYSDPEDLLEIAKVADKYDCSEALTPLAEFWLKDHKRYRLGPLRNCFACAYLFRRPELFTEFGNQLLLDSQEVIPDLRELYPYLQDKIQPIIAAINATRTATIIDLNAFVDGIAAEVTDSTEPFDISCGQLCRSKLHYQDMYLRQIFNSCLRPQHIDAVRPMLDVMDRFQFNLVGVEWQSKWAPCSQQCHIAQVNSKDDWTWRFWAKQEQVAGALPKFCLGCVLEGKVFQEQGCGH